MGPFISTVRDLISPESWQWNRHLIRELFEEDTAVEILRMPLPRDDREDRWIWTKEVSGVISVKYVVRAAQLARALDNTIMPSISWTRL